MYVCLCLCLCIFRDRESSLARRRSLRMGVKSDLMQTVFDVKRTMTAKFADPFQRCFLQAVVLFLNRVALTRDVARLTYRDLSVGVV